MVMTILLHVIAALLWFHMFRMTCADIGVTLSYRYNQKETPAELDLLFTTRNMYLPRRRWFFIHVLICVALSWAIGSDPDLFWLLGGMLKTLSVMMIIVSFNMDRAIRHWIPYSERLEA